MEELDLSYPTKKYQANRNNFKLTDEERLEIQETIDNVELTNEDLILINNKISNSEICDYINRKTKFRINREYFIRISYIMRYKLKLITKVMASFLNIDHKMFTHKMKQLGWGYSPEEAQQLAAKVSRDYTSIRIKGKQTMLQSLNKSPMEDKIREYINLKLAELLPKYEVIVGCNNLSILSDINKEIDIPIIIFKGKKVYKYAIELNGSYWHEFFKRDDETREKAILNKGYKYYILWHCSNNKDRENHEVEHTDKEIDKVINEIIQDIKHKK